MHPHLPLDQILIGDCRELLKTLPDDSVHCVVTSPPYWGLRSYGTDPQVWANGHEPCVEHQWGDEEIKRTGRNDGDMSRHGETRGTYQYDHLGGPKAASQGNACSVCGAWRGELGLEPTPELFCEHLTQIFREVKRVLRDDGTLWLNLGDSYTSSTKGDNRTTEQFAKSSGLNMSRDLSKSQSHQAHVTRGTWKVDTGLKPKDLVGIPWMVAFALRADGWYLRSDIIWAKPNPMPESVTDRPTKAHEYIFLLSKSQRYYYDADAVREPYNANSLARYDYQFNPDTPSNQATKNPATKGGKIEPNPTGRNKRSVWTVATHPFKGAHFATFPPKLIEPCILAGCPVGGVVLDPFIGSGTTASVCISLKRHYIGFDLNPAYVEGIAQDRADNTPPPLFVL